MEGVGARLGRSSTRYGPATVFNGPVRKWKKRWIHVSPSSNSNNSTNHPQNPHSFGTTISINGTTSNGNNCSHLLFYKWTPLTQSTNKDNLNNANDVNNTNGDKESVNEDAASLDRPRRKFKYIPVYEIEKRKKEIQDKAALENVDDEPKPNDADPIAVRPVPQSDGFSEKPDINDIPMEKSQNNNQVVRQDLNESTLDLSLGLKSHDGNSDSKPEQPRNGAIGKSELK